MILTVKNRSALLDKNLHIVPEDTTKDFFTYFDFQCEHIVDFVHPDEQERFVALVTGKYDTADERSDIFHLLRNTGEYRYNFVTVRNVRGPYAARIRLFDIYDAIEFTRTAVEVNCKIHTVFSLTNTYLFEYRKSDGMFSIFYYNQNQEIILSKMELLAWKQQMLDSGIVPASSAKQLDMMMDDFRIFPYSFNVKLKCAIRTGGAMMEQLHFMGTRYEGMEDTYMLGCILTDESLSKIRHSHTLLDELQLDGLTQVYNKKTITAYAEQKIKANLPDSFALVIVDLDHFKPVNDQYGHLTGDKVIARAAAKLKEVVGEDGVVGRFGGDEFMLILDGIANVQILRGMLRAVMTQIKKEFEGNFEGISLTCSLGAAVFPTNGTTYDELFKKADFCLYRAKDKGRDRYIFFRDDLHAQAYAESQEAKIEGKKTEGREVQELRHMANYLHDLYADSHGAAMDVMRHMLGTYAADCISVYAGERMERILHVGVDRAESEYAEYVLQVDFKKALDADGVVRFDFPNEIPEDAFGSELRRRGVCSTIHCVIGNPAEPKGVVAFNKLHTPSRWAEYEVNCACLFAASLAVLNLDEL